MLTCADYWASVVFKQVVGTRVLSVANSTALGRTTRVYAWCAATSPGGVVLLAININMEPTSFALQVHARAVLPE